MRPDLYSKKITWPNLGQKILAWTQEHSNYWASVFCWVKVWSFKLNRIEMKTQRQNKQLDDFWVIAKYIDKLNQLWVNEYAFLTAAYQQQSFNSLSFSSFL